MIKRQRSDCNEPTTVPDQLLICCHQNLNQSPDKSSVYTSLQRGTFPLNTSQEPLLIIYLQAAKLQLSRYYSLMSATMYKMNCCVHGNSLPSCKD